MEWNDDGIHQIEDAMLMFDKQTNRHRGRHFSFHFHLMFQFFEYIPSDSLLLPFCCIVLG